MSMRGGGNMMRDSLDDTLANLQDQQDNLSDDDNAQPELQEQELEIEDPLLLAIDDLEGRVVSALDDVRIHSGVRTSSAPGAPNIHEELAIMLRPVLEVAAHTGPSIARTYYRGEGTEGIEASVEDVYERVVSDLVLPVVLEMAQSERNPAKLGASLEFFHSFWKECHKAGSWLDATTTGPQAGPYGAGGSHSSSAANPALKPLLQKRLAKRTAREAEILRYWVQASIACTEPGVLTSDEGEGAVASRGVLAACASLRPSLRHIAQRIKDTDDRGANRLYGPVMRMVEGVFKKLFLGNSGEAIRSACIKFLEIVILCCSFKVQDASGKRRGITSSSDFSLDDLPAGHPVITREALESVAEYAFTTLRGLTFLGGQIKIDANILSDMLMTAGGGGSPSSQVVSILKPAALAYLEIESNLPKEETGNVLSYTLDRTAVEFEFELSQKSYTLSINAMQALAANRPAFFKEAAVCISRRAVQPPVYLETGTLSKSAVIAITSQLKSTCLAMLRNSLSITTKASDVLRSALLKYDMEIQADKALSMAKQATDLKTAGRAARNRANMYYEWDASDNDRSSRRQRETDDALAKMRAAKAARGLGHGIQLPTSMTDSIDLIMINLDHLPSEPPKRSTSTAGRIAISLDYVVDAIITNGASLSHEEGHWYERDGSAAWNINMDSEEKYSLKENFVGLLSLNFENGEKQDEAEPEKKRRKIIHEQIDLAASNALGRILASVTNYESKSLGALAGQLTSRLCFVLAHVHPSALQEEQFNMAKESIPRMEGRYFDNDTALSLTKFTEVHPLVASSLAADVMPTSQNNGQMTSIGKAVLNEAFMQCCDNTETESKWWKYDCTLALYVCLVVYAGEVANQKPNDEARKKAAADASHKLQLVMPSLPRLTETSVNLLAGFCDLEEITKKVASAQRQTSQEAIAVAAATHAAKQAAEKRAKCGLLILRDLACQKTSTDIRKWAVNCAAAIASGRLPSNPKVQENGLALVVNVLFTKNDLLSEFVVRAAKDELQHASQKAIDSYDQIETANKEAEPKVVAAAKKNPFVARSTEEKQLLEQMRGPALLFMALCLRIPELIADLFAFSSAEKADVLSKAVRMNMMKLSKASAAKHGKTEIALKVAQMTGPKEVPLLLSFLETLAALSDRNNPDQDVIDACYQIQELKKTEGGEKDPRFVIPVVGYMLRNDLEAKLIDFAAADDNVLMSALGRMGERLNAQALLFREEQDEETPTLRGMTLCEQLVFLHKLDFSSLDLPQQQKQRRYLSAIKLCLEEEDVYNDSVVMSALDHISGTFLTSGDKLPLAFMRTCILVCSQHESLHSWICNELLPRLVDGKIYEDARQWEGWMRCAHMLENSGQSGVSSLSAVAKLPPEQLMQYRTKWASSSGV